MADDDSGDLRKALTALVLDDLAFRELECRLDVFCPFEAMGVVGAEIRHANFLAHAMDPAAPHGFGTVFLRAFLSALMDEVANPPMDRLRIHLAELEDTEVVRELEHMDLVILLPTERVAVIIELKIDAAETGKQLETYRSVAERRWSAASGWKRLLVFLTPNGRPPSDDHWHAVSYDVVTTAADHLLADGGTGRAPARELMKAYAAMLRRRHMSDEDLEKLARDLWRRHRQALTYLVEQAPDIAGGFAAYVVDHVDELAAGASVAGLSLVSDRKVPSAINFGVEEWDVLPGMRDGKGWTKSGRVLMLELQVRPKFIDLLFYVGPGPRALRDSLIATMKLGGRALKETEKWRKVVKRRWELDLESLDADEFPARFDELRTRLRAFVEDEVKVRHAQVLDAVARAS